MFILENLRNMHQLTIYNINENLDKSLCGILYDSSRVPLVTSNYTALQYSYKKDHIKVRLRKEIYRLQCE